jgi:hypothetical protein
MQFLLPAFAFQFNCCCVARLYIRIFMRLFQLNTKATYRYTDENNATQQALTEVMQPAHNKDHHSTLLY